MVHRVLQELAEHQVALVHQVQVEVRVHRVRQEVVAQEVLVVHQVQAVRLVLL